MRNAWKARFPNITLDLSVDLSKYHDSRIDRAWYNKNETVDIATLQTLHDFKRWKQQDRLMYYKPANFDDLYNGEKDLDGAFLPMGMCKSLHPQPRNNIKENPHLTSPPTKKTTSETSSTIPPN